MLNTQLINQYKQDTIEQVPEGEWKQFLWYLWRGTAYVGLFLAVGMAVMLWFVAHIVFAAWRDPKG